MIRLALLSAALFLASWQDDAPAPAAVPALPVVAPPSPVVAIPDLALGQDLVQARCTSCHDSSRYTSQRLNEAQWRTMIDNMIGHGARISAEEVPPILAYLVSAHGPQAPAAAETPRGSPQP